MRAFSVEFAVEERLPVWHRFYMTSRPITRAYAAPRRYTSRPKRTVPRALGESDCAIPASKHPFVFFIYLSLLLSFLVCSFPPPEPLHGACDYGYDRKCNLLVDITSARGGDLIGTTLPAGGKTLPRRCNSPCRVRNRASDAVAGHDRKRNQRDTFEIAMHPSEQDRGKCIQHTYIHQRPLPGKQFKEIPFHERYRRWRLLEKRR